MKRLNRSDLVPATLVLLGIIVLHSGFFALLPYIVDRVFGL